MSKFGLIGKNIAYSFSRAYFKEKFAKENLPHEYVNFDIASIDKFQNILKEDSNINGFNVTIPYKETIIPHLDKLNKKAKLIGAVNTIRINKKGKLVGHNTDYYGFKKSIKPYLKSHHKKALILGTGGASKAIAFALDSLEIEYDYVSRNISKKSKYSYNTLSQNTLKEYQIIVNCTPLGTFPNVNDYPKIPYNAITSDHLLYDLIYNPSETKFLSFGRQFGAQTCNGLKMLELQAEKSWRIWNK